MAVAHVAGCRLAFLIIGVVVALFALAAVTVLVMIVGKLVRKSRSDTRFELPTFLQS